MSDIITEIHACPWKGVIAITGCSPGLVTNLLAPGGGSATLLEAIVPYATKSLEQFIGTNPENRGWKFCSAEVAAEMASKAFSRATELVSHVTELGNAPEGPCFGLGITATLRKNGSEREGRVHQVFLSFQTCNMAYNHHVIFDNELTRPEEECLVSEVALDVLSRHLLNKRYPATLPFCTDNQLSDDWMVSEYAEKQKFPRHLQKLLDGCCSDEDIVWDPKSGLLDTETLTNRIVIPGSFNPVHDGHFSMAQAACKYFGSPPAKPLLELSIANVDKGRLSGYEVLNRVKSFKDYQVSKQTDFADLVITDADTFVLKSFRFPKSTFIIGIDTWYRLIDPRYYRHNKLFMEECHAKIKENGCSFLVLGRFINGSYHTLPPEKSCGLAVGLSEEEFRVDLSSTQIRQKS